MTKREAGRSLVLMSALLMSTGCYKYIPTEAGLVPEGDDVRVLVTRLGAEQFSQVAPEGLRSGVITGTMMGIEDDDIVMSVPVGERREGFMVSSLTQTIRVPIGEVLDVDRREFDGLATGAIVGVAAAGVATIIFGIIQAFGTGDPGDEGDPPVDFTFGLFSLPIGG